MISYQEVLRVRPLARVVWASCTRLVGRIGAVSCGYDSRGFSAVSMGPLKPPFPTHTRFLSKDWPALSSIEHFSSYAAPRDTVTDCPMKVEALSKDETRGLVTVTWSDGEEQEYPFVWLRDNCFCSQCYHSESEGRLSFGDLDVTACPESVETANDNDTVRITWDRSHNSDFTSSWLRTFRFDREPRDGISSHIQRLWGAEIKNSLPRFDFHDILSDDKALFEFLKAFSEVGITVVNGVPAKPKQIPVIAKRVGLMQETSFGLLQPLKQGGYQEEALETERALSYTNKALQLHTDMSCLTESPSMAYFHCIETSNDSGGYSQYSDGFKAADTLRQTDPVAFKRLCTNQQEFRLVGEEPHVGAFDHRAYHTFITLDNDGKLKSIYYSTHARLPSMRMPVSEVGGMYSAIQQFHNLINSPENVFNVKLQDGEMMVINNHRVLHGRTAFNSTSKRYLELGYVHMDHVTSRMRVLQHKPEAEA